MSLSHIVRIFIIFEHIAQWLLVFSLKLFVLWWKDLINDQTLNLNVKALSFLTINRSGLGTQTQRQKTYFSSHPYLISFLQFVEETACWVFLIADGKNYTPKNNRKLYTSFNNYCNVTFYFKHFYTGIGKSLNWAEC